MGAVTVYKSQTATIHENSCRMGGKMTKTAATMRRHSESLAERQARVGIVANPHRVPLNVPVSREVWSRWPDLRARTRRLNNAQDAARAQDRDALTGFAQSVRWPTTGRAMGRWQIMLHASCAARVAIFLVLGAMVLAALGYALLHTSILL